MEKLRQDFLVLKADLKRTSDENERLIKKIGEYERKNDKLMIEKQSMERIIEVQKKQMLDQIRVLQEGLACEKDTKEKWLQRYEIERDHTAKLNDQLIAVQNQFKDLDMMHKSKEGKFSVQNNEIQQLRDRAGALHKQLTETS